MAQHLPIATSTLPTLRILQYLFVRRPINYMRWTDVFSFSVNVSLFLNCFLLLTTRISSTQLLYSLDYFTCPLEIFHRQASFSSTKNRIPVQCRSLLPSKKETWPRLVCLVDHILLLDSYYSQTRVSFYNLFRLSKIKSLLIFPNIFYTASGQVLDLSAIWLLNSIFIHNMLLKTSPDAYLDNPGNLTQEATEFKNTLLVDVHFLYPVKYFGYMVMISWMLHQLMMSNCIDVLFCSVKRKNCMRGRFVYEMKKKIWY